MRKLLLIKFIFLCLILMIPAITLAAPRIFYTDFISGPITGGENNNGMFLCIFGQDFGSSSDLGTNTLVYINDVEVADYVWMGTAYGRTDIQRLCIQPGGSVTTGAIRVNVNGTDSNTDHTFTVATGDIFWVAETGSDANPGTLASPKRNVSSMYSNSSYGPGDVIVVRGGTYPSTQTTFLTMNKDGSTGLPLMVGGYPGEDVLIPSWDGRSSEMIDMPSSGNDFQSLANLVTVWANQTTWGIGSASVVKMVGQDERMANMVISGNNSQGNGNIVTNNCTRCKFLGMWHSRNGHENQAGLQLSAYYFGSADQIEIAWGGCVNQIYGRCGPFGRTGTWGETEIHHEVYFDSEQQCINMGAGSLGPFYIHDNVLYDCNYNDPKAHVIVASPNSGFELYFYNNTIYSNAGSGPMTIPSGITAADISNNIFFVEPGGSYGSYGAQTTGSNNIWYGLTDSAPSFDSSPITSDPLFVDLDQTPLSCSGVGPSCPYSLTGRNFKLSSGSPAIDAGIDGSTYTTTDFYQIARPQGPDYDIGAFEYLSSNPSLSSATISSNGTTLTLNFSEAVTQGTGYNDSDFDIDCSSTGNNISITYSSGNGSGTHTYTISSTIDYGETCDIDFNGDTDSLEDSEGNDVAAITSQSVTNNSIQNAWTLTVTVSTGTGSGSVTSSPSGISCETDCSEIYNDATSVTLTPSASSNSDFVAWSGDPDCSDDTFPNAVITMDSNITCNAQFDLKTWTLTITKAGTGNGTVSSSPAGINCGSDCTQDYNHGSIITLSQSEDPNSIFDGFSGDADCSDSSVTMTTNVSCIANYTAITETFTLTITLVGAGSGIITSSPSGINCGSDCTETFNDGTELTLSFAANNGSRFTRWEGDNDCTGGVDSNLNLVFSITADTTCNARFTKKKFFIFGKLEEELIGR